MVAEILYDFLGCRTELLLYTGSRYPGRDSQEPTNNLLEVKEHSSIGGHLIDS